MPNELQGQVSRTALAALPECFRAARARREYHLASIPTTTEALSLPGGNRLLLLGVAIATRGKMID